MVILRNHNGLATTTQPFGPLKGTVSPPERCDFTSSQQYSNNVL